MKYAIAAVSIVAAALAGYGAYYYSQQPTTETPVEPEVDVAAEPVAETI